MMRIKEMEQCLDQATEALAQTEAALNAFKAAQPAIAMLEAYLGSDDWRKDLAADERGLLPPDLKRGVLSEDGIWNLLERNRELLQQMQVLATQGLKDTPEP